MQRILRLLAAILIISALPFSAPYVAYANTKTVRVGYFSFEGYHMLDNGVKSGYGYEILQHMLGYTNWKYEYVGYDKSWTDMLDMLESGEIDMVTSAQMTDERLKTCDFSREAIGSSSGVLAVYENNNEYIVGDWDNWNGMRVGMLSGNSRNDGFARYANERGFTYEPVYFSSMDELIGSLSLGVQIDAAVISNLYLANGESIIAEFEPSQFYIIVKKGNAELMSQIDFALESMFSAEPDLRSNLWKKYYSARTVMNARSVEETEYISSMNGKSLKAIINPDRAPYSMFDNCVPSGVFSDIADIISNRTGIDIEIIETASRDEYEDYYLNGDYDICIDAAYNFPKAEKAECRLTPSYIQIPISRLFKRSNSSHKSVAILIGTDISSDFARTALKRYESISYYHSVDDIVSAILSGDVDDAYLYESACEMIVLKDDRNRLNYDRVYDGVTDYCVAVKADVGVVGYRIICEALSSITEIDTENILSKNRKLYVSDVSLTRFIYDNAFELLTAFIAIVAATGLIIALVCAFRGKKKEYTRLMAEKKRGELLAQALSAAEQADAAKNEFLSRVSHEMRTPLNAIIGFLELTKGADEKTAEDYRVNSEIAAKQLLSIINDVLDMSAITAGKIRISLEPFDLCALLSSLSDVFKPQFAKKGVEFSVHSDLGIDRWLIGDRLRLNQILLNLLSNALKFTQSGCVKVSAEKLSLSNENVKIRFIVSDTGCGMSSELMERLFKPFEQESAATAEKYGGSGLGLSIVKSLVGLMGGEISVISESGRGTTFTVDIPFAISDIQTEVKKPGKLDKYDFTGRRVLLVEDNAINRRVAEGILARVGVTAESAVDGMDALDKFIRSASGYYDCVLMDIQMPVMNGYDATRAIRASAHPDAKTIQVIALTANAFLDDINRARDAGMNGHVAKPIDISTLCACLNSAFTAKDGGNG